MVMPEARRNGLDWPPSFFQVLSWALFLLLVASFYALELLYTDVVGRAVAGALYGIFAVTAFVAGSFATVTDPADHSIYEREPKWAPRELVPGHLYCYRCERHVKDTSKHCTLCMKCVDAFDHHCLWLSNCVGTHNYRAFLTLLVGAAAQLLLQVGYGIYVIVKFGQSPGDFDSRVREFYPYLAGGVFFGLTVAITALAIVTAALVLQLLSFHGYLIYHGISTYDYIVTRAAGVGPGGSSGGGGGGSRASVSSRRSASRARSSRTSHGGGRGSSNTRSHGSAASAGAAGGDSVKAASEAAAGTGAAATAPIGHLMTPLPVEGGQPQTVLQSPGGTSVRRFPGREEGHEEESAAEAVTVTAETGGAADAAAEQSAVDPGGPGGGGLSVV